MRDRSIPLDHFINGSISGRNCDQAAKTSGLQVMPF